MSDKKLRDLEKQLKKEPANLALRFLLELAALAAMSWWGWETGGSTAARLALAIVFPLAVAFVWGTFIAPKARVY